MIAFARVICAGLSVPPGSAPTACSIRANVCGAILALPPSVSETRLLTVVPPALSVPADDSFPPTPDGPVADGVSPGVAGARNGAPPRGGGCGAGAPVVVVAP